LLQDPGGAFQAPAGGDAEADPAVSRVQPIEQLRQGLAVAQQRIVDIADQQPLDTGQAAARAAVNVGVTAAGQHLAHAAQVLVDVPLPGVVLRDAAQAAA